MLATNIDGIQLITEGSRSHYPAQAVVESLTRGAQRHLKGLHMTDQSNEFTNFLLLQRNVQVVFRKPGDRRDGVQPKYGRILDLCTVES